MLVVPKFQRIVTQADAETTAGEYSRTVISSQQILQSSMQHPNLADDYTAGFDYDPGDGDAHKSIVTFRNINKSIIGSVQAALCCPATYENTKLEVYDNIIFGLLSQIDTSIGIPAH